METQNRNQVANTILAQLGGNKFVTMTGAYNLSADKDCLIFKIGKNPKNVKAVKIVLDASDTYTMIFYSIRKFEVKELEKVADVYCDQLQSIFTSVTGMPTAL